MTGLPITIPPKEAVRVFAAIHASKSDVGKPLSGTVLFYLDVPSAPVFLSVSARTILDTNDELLVEKKE